MHIITNYRNLHPPTGTCDLYDTEGLIRELTYSMTPGERITYRAISAWCTCSYRMHMEYKLAWGPRETPDRPAPGEIKARLREAGWIFIPRLLISTGYVPAHWICPGPDSYGMKNETQNVIYQQHEAS